MPFKKHFIRYWLPAVLGLALVLWLSSGTFSYRNTGFLITPILCFLDPEIPVEQVILIHSWIRKAGHFMEYFILGLLLVRAFRGRFVGRLRFRWHFFALGVVVLWAAGDEFLQSLTPARSSSALDVGIDAAGAVMAQFVSASLSVVRRRGPKARSPHPLTRYLSNPLLDVQPAFVRSEYPNRARLPGPPRIFS